MRGCMRRGRTEELLCGDEQMCDGLFYLRELLLGLHFICGQWLLLGVGRGERESEGEPMLLHVHSWAHGVKTPETSGQKTTPLSCCRVGVAQVCGVNSRVKGRTGSAKARRHSIPGSSVGDHVGCTDV